MIVSIMQPAYLPWLGYFDRIMKSDLHLVLDDVQITHGDRNSFTNRNKIRQKDGWSWLTVPILTTGRQGQLDIDAVEVSQTQPWQVKHPQSLHGAYARTPHFAEFFPAMQAIYATPVTRLVDIIDPLTDFQLTAFGIETPIVRTSTLKVGGTKADLVLNLCREVGATRYLSGPFGRDYLNLDDFEKAGIAIDWHDYAHPDYKQAFPGFEPYMAAIDLLFNHGRAGRAVLSAGKSPS